MSRDYNLILDTDSYKFSHYRQYAQGVRGGRRFRTGGMFSYLESRGGRHPATVFFGLQYLLLRYLDQPVSAADVEEARQLAEAHGEPFNLDGWRRIVEVHGGRLPVRIRAVPEGTVVPVHQALMTVESTDPECFWLVSFLETLLMRVWYPTTVATQSHRLKQLIYGHLQRSAEDPEAQIGFKLHDFGCRGVSSLESAAWGGAAHLVNFLGTDTVPALSLLRRYYGAPMAGFSIPAAEHSTITSWGREGEADAYRNMLAQYAAPGRLLAVVSDSYDIYRACEEIWGGILREEVLSSGATLVVRPDSGHPATVVLACVEILGRKFGCSENRKGFKVLHPSVRVIQGDGVDEDSIGEILDTLERHGWSAENVGFGMGGALLQKVNRDTQKFAFKCSSVTRLYEDGTHEEVAVSKSPVTDPGKASRKGRLDLIEECGSLRTVVLEPGQIAHPDSAMVTVFENGEVLRVWTLEQIRGRAWNGATQDLDFVEPAPMAASA